LAAGQFEPPCPQCGAPLGTALVNESAPLDPRNAYASSKVAQEYYASNWARTTGGSVAAMRYHNVYGPGMPRDTPYAGVAAIFTSALRRGEAPKVFEDGGQRRDFVHVRDVAAATVLACETHCAGVRAFNLGSGTPRTVGDMARALAMALSGPSPGIIGSATCGTSRRTPRAFAMSWDGRRGATSRTGWPSWRAPEHDSDKACPHLMLASPHRVTAYVSSGRRRREP